VKLGEVVNYISSCGYSIEIEVDGNVSWENIPKMLEASVEL
jgi:pentose-5-phosphate-3-epimerase